MLYYLMDGLIKLLIPAFLPLISMGMGSYNQRHFFLSVGFLLS